jgi:hypothetical protein
LVPDALKNTNLKIIHRLVAEDDRKAVAGTINLNETQTRALMTLNCGEGVAYSEGMRKPVLLRVPLAKAKQSGRAVTNAEICDNPDVREFWKTNQLLRIPFAACLVCKGSVKGASCHSHAADRVNWAVRDAFRRLYNALWVAGGLAIEAFEDFRSLCLALPTAVREPRLAYCLFVEMVDAEAERRGAAWGWRHRDVERVIAAACEFAAIMEDRRPDSSVPKKFEDLRDEHATFVTGLHKLNHQPYSGCAACRHRCMFRFDMELQAQDPYVSEFQEAVDDEDVSDGTLAEICRTAGKSVFSTADEEITDAAGLCFAVQRFSTMDFSRDEQRANSARIADLLKKSTS